MTIPCASAGSASPPDSDAFRGDTRTDRLARAVIVRQAPGNDLAGEIESLPIDYPAHYSSQRVNFPHQVPLGDSADRGVTRHLTNQIQVNRYQSCFRSHAAPRPDAASQPCMASTDDNYVKDLVEHHKVTFQYRRSRRSVTAHPPRLFHRLSHPASAVRCANQSEPVPRQFPRSLNREMIPIHPWCDKEDHSGAHPLLAGPLHLCQTNGTD